MAAAPTAQSRALAGLCVCVALGDSGEYGAELATAQDAVVEGHLAGLDRGNGCYFDSLAADALVRLGRWTEVAGLLARHPLPDTLPVVRLQLARVKAVLAAQRGDRSEALAEFAVAHRLPVDGWHAILRDAAISRLASIGCTPETDPCVILDGPTLEICFQEVEVPVMEKRPLHFDISSADRARERSHLVSLGASIVQEFEQHTWMRGPEGNDFCLTDA